MFNWYFFGVVHVYLTIWKIHEGAFIYFGYIIYSGLHLITGDVAAKEFKQF